MEKTAAGYIRGRTGPTFHCFPVSCMLKNGFSPAKLLGHLKGKENKMKG